MTYFGFLLRFLIIPLITLLVITVWEVRKGKLAPGFQDNLVWPVIFIHVALALIYTTPWDNYLVASGVWTYNPDLVSGILFGYVPVEEYIFFVLETITAGLWWWFLARRVALPSGEFKPSLPVRLWATGVLVVFWVFFGALFFSGWEPGTYLSITLFWALPAIFPQFLFGADILWYYRKLLALTIVPMAVYLSLVDIFALTAGTWTIASSKSTGIMIGGVLPVEEVIFFFITNFLIGFGMTLILSNLGHDRLEQWKFRRFRGLPWIQLSNNLKTSFILIWKHFVKMGKTSKPRSGLYRTEKKYISALSMIPEK
jgi:lycopene beta-cyclase